MEAFLHYVFVIQYFDKSVFMNLFVLRNQKIVLLE